MKRIISKRFISLALAIIMVAALIPSTAFAAVGELANYNYVFSTATHGIDERNSKLTSGNHGIDKMVSGSESSPWGFVNVYGFGISTLWKDYLSLAIGDADNAGVAFAPGASTEEVHGKRTALAFEISASEGTYDAKLSVNPQTTSTELEVYLVPKSKYEFPVYDGTNSETFYSNVEAMSANYRIGKVDLYGENAENTDLYIGRVKLTEEDYYLVLVPSGVDERAVRDDQNRWIMQPTGFKLDGVAENTAVEQDISAAISTAKQSVNKNSYSKKFNIAVKENVLTVDDACIYFYGNTADKIPLVVMEFDVNKAGKYNIQLKTNADGVSIKNFAAAPLVSYAKYDENFATMMTNAQTEIGKTTEIYTGDSMSKFKELEGYTEIGYFDFSEISAAETYYNVEPNGASNSENGVLEFEENGKYFIAFSLDLGSIKLSGGTVSETAYGGGTASGNEEVTSYETNMKAYAYQAFIISGINLVPVADEYADAYKADRKLYDELTSVTADNNEPNTLAGYSSTATVTVVAQDIATGESVATDVVNENVGVNTEYMPSAPSVGDDYEFMYWAIGLGANRKIVSFDKDEYSFEVAPGRNLVYAVYRKTNNETKYAFFFDGSKTVMGKKEISDGSVTLPALPGAMPAFGNPTGWKYTAEENETALSVGTAVENLTDDTFFVADYNGKKTVTVTIDGKEYDFTYGEDVKLGDYASVRENKSGENVFNYWKKGDEIISFKPNYTFKAYEDCTLTSTYAKYEPINKTVRRILLSTDATTGITFAEFIGLDNAIEKGILFCDEDAKTYTDARAKAVMQTDANVFSVVNETGKTAVGYAILSDGKIVYSDR
ncbi:MAG: hypothetical protein E7441_05280 [Ruminococcaceae bacterium]|nr:hypothetical protein [Oscillospiraceae bacterium]